MPEKYLVVSIVDGAQWAVNKWKVPDNCDASITNELS